MSDTQPAIGVIAGNSHQESIAEILASDGFTPASFNCISDISNEEGFADDLAAIVIWVDGALSPVARLIEPLTRRLPDSPVVVVCTSIERRDVRAALAAGVTGVVVYDDLHICLSPCLQAVRVGQICVPREHWRQIEPPALSTREKQILGLVVMGYMNSQIAGQLFLAESTVKSHLSSAFGKLGVRSRNEAVDLILNPERGLGMGILRLGGEPVERTLTTTR